VTAPFLTPEPCEQQILNTLQEIDKKVAVMAEKLGALTDHEVRIRALERLVWPLAAFPTLLAALAIIKDWI
jgi:hypothetical protein